MKKRFRPYLNKFFGMTLLWVILLILLIWAEPIQIIVVYRRWNYKLLAAIAAVIYALRYAVRHFIPDVLAILDSVSNSFRTEKMVFVSGRIVGKGYFCRSSAFEKSGSGRPGLYPRFYSEVILADNLGRTAFLTSDLHLMKENEYYTVTYGKHSKILLSVQSKQGEEMLFEAE